MKYVLEGHAVIPCASTLEWAQWFESHDRQVARDTTPNGADVSTVFLGIDHSFGRGGPPLVFETMVFGGNLGGMQERYATWDEAVAGHASALADALRHDHITVADDSSKEDGNERR